MPYSNRLQENVVSDRNNSVIFTLCNKNGAAKAKLSPLTSYLLGGNLLIPISHGIWTQQHMRLREGLIQHWLSRVKHF